MSWSACLNAGLWRATRDAIVIVPENMPCSPYNNATFINGLEEYLRDRKGSRPKKVQESATSQPVW